MLCSIYKITNQTNGKIYVGQTWQTLARRFWDHKKPRKRGCIKLKRALKKYGKDNFSIEIITVCGTQDTADYWETYFIRTFDCIKKGYNIREGGSHGKMAEETKRKISKLNSGRFPSQETRKKISSALSGPTHYYYGKPTWNKGIPRDDKTKNAISNTKRKLTDEQIIAIKNDPRPQVQICKDYGVSHGTISNIKNNKLRYCK